MFIIECMKDEKTKEIKKIDWKPEDNNYLNSVLDKVNLILAFAVIFAPLITSLFCLVGLKLDFKNCLLIIYLVFMLIKIISISLNFRFIKFRKPDILEVLGVALLLMLCVTEIINRPIKAQFIFTVGYFLAFFIFIKVDKKYYKALLYSFVLTIAVCLIMGVCDLNNRYMPGFLDYTYPMSLQFYNPNYSAYITVMAIMLCMYVISTYKTKVEQIIFWTAYVVLNVCLFINGCFSAETAMFVGQIFLLIYLWIRNKKCPWIILVCLFISIASSFVWIRGYSSSSANFMFEALAVIDNNLGTTLAKDVSTFFDKLFGTGVIEKVAGSDGWGRADAKQVAVQEIFASPKSVLFGYGMVYNNKVLVHNVPLQIWLEYGVFNLVLYLSILVILAVRLFKTKFSSHNVFVIAFMISVVFVCHYFGCLEPYSFTYFVSMLAIAVKSLDQKYKALKSNNKAKKN